jgi:hypothetical protein
VGGRVAQSGIIYNSSHSLRADTDALVTPQLVTDPPHSRIRIITPHLLDTPLQLTANSAGTGIRGLPHQGFLTALKVELAPFTKRGPAHAHQFTDLCTSESRLKSINRQKLDLNRKCLALFDGFCCGSLLPGSRP